MANLGKYQVGDELYRTAFRSVCYAIPLNAAESTGGAKDFVAKIYAPAPGTDDADPSPSGGLSPLALEFIEGVKAHQQVAASAKHWAPIHDSGTADGKPYYVTNYYARTAQKLLSGRVRLNPVGLHEIMQSVVVGLVELKIACGRTHGNLKPTNVLIAGSGSVAEGKIVLTDPAAGPHDGTEAEAKDLRAVGELLYQLVMHKPAITTTLSVAESEEWTRLGRRGREWRQLCGDLLSLDAIKRMPLSDLERTVRRLVPIKIPVGKIAAAVVGCAAVFGTTGTVASRWEQAARAEVIATQDQWFAVLQDPSRACIIDTVPALRDCLADDRAHQEVIQAALGAEGWAALKPAIVRQVMDARDSSRNSRRKWVAAFKKESADLGDKLNAFRCRGWKMPAAVSRVPTVDENSPAQAIANGAAQLRDLRLRITGNDPSAKWAALEQNLDKLRKTNDVYLRRFADLLEKRAAEAITLKNEGWIATQDLQQSDDYAAKLADKGKIDFDVARFTAEENVNLEHPEIASIDRWLSKVDQYVPDPNAGQTAADEGSKEISIQIAEGLAQHEEQWPQWKSPKFTEAKTKIDNEVAALRRTHYLVKDVRQNAENRGRLYDKRTSIKLAIADLRSKYYKPPLNPVDFVANLPRPDLKDEGLRDIYLRNIDDLKGKKPGDLSTVQLGARAKQIQALQKVLKTLDDFAQTPPIIELPSPYREIAITRRSAKFDPILKQVGDGMSLAGDDLDSLAAQAQKDSIAFAQWCNSAKDLARDFHDFNVPAKDNQILEITRFPDQNWRASGDTQVSTFWQTEVIAAGAPFNAILGSLVNRLDKLRAVQQGDLIAVTTLLTTANTPAEVLVAAWRRVASEGLLARPASIAQLSQEGVVRVNLGGVKARIDRKDLLASDSLNRDLNQELARGPVRWCDAVKAGGSAVDIRTALSVTQQFDLNFAIDEKTAIPAGKVAIVAAPNLAAHAGDLGPVAYYNVTLALAQDAIASKNAVVAPSRLDALAKAADVLPPPGRSDYAPLVRWLQTARTAYSEPLRVQLEALLQDSLFLFPPNQQPNIFAQVLAASNRLKDKQPQQGVALLKSFLPADGPLRVQFAKQFYDLGNSPTRDATTQKDALMQSMRLGNKDAIAALMKIDSIDKTAIIAELKTLADAGNVDALVQMAKINEKGWGVPVNLIEARRYYTLADYRQSPEARDWLKIHPLPPPEPVYANEVEAANTLLQYQSDVAAKKWPQAEADLKKFNVMRDVSPALRQKIEIAQATFSPPPPEPIKPPPVDPAILAAQQREATASDMLSQIQAHVQAKRLDEAEADLGRLQAMRSQLSLQTIGAIDRAMDNLAAARAASAPVSNPAETEAKDTLAAFRGHIRDKKLMAATADVKKLQAMRDRVPALAQDIDRAERSLRDAKTSTSQ